MMYTLCACLHVYTLYSVHVYTVCIHASLLVLTWNVISAHDYLDSAMQELLLGGARTKVCLGTNEAGITCTA